MDLDSLRRACGIVAPITSLTPIWTLDAATGERKELALWPRPRESEYSAPTVAAWTPDGKRVAAWKILPPTVQGTARAELHILNANTGVARATELLVNNLKKPLNVLSIHPDGRRITYSVGHPAHEIWKLSNFLDRLAAND